MGQTDGVVEALHRLVVHHKDGLDRGGQSEVCYLSHTHVDVANSVVGNRGERIAVHSHLEDSGRVLRSEALVEDIAQVDQTDALRLPVCAEVKSSPEALDTLVWITLHPPVERGEVVGCPAGLLLLEHLGNTVTVLCEPVI